MLKFLNTTVDLDMTVTETRANVMSRLFAVKKNLRMYFLQNTHVIFSKSSILGGISYFPGKKYYIEYILLRYDLA